MDRWAARAQRKSDDRAARWQERRQERAQSGRLSITDRWVARAQRKSDARVARWKEMEQQPPPPPWPAHRYLLLAAGSFVIAVVGISVGSASQDHVPWLSELMTLPAGLGFAGVIGGLLRARKARRAQRWYLRDWLAPREGQPSVVVATFSTGSRAHLRRAILRWLSVAGEKKKRHQPMSQAPPNE